MLQVRDVTQDFSDVFCCEVRGPFPFPFHETLFGGAFQWVWHFLKGMAVQAWPLGVG